MVAVVPQGPTGLQQLNNRDFQGRGPVAWGITGCRWYRQFPHPPCHYRLFLLTHTALGEMKYWEAHLIDEEMRLRQVSPCSELPKLLPRSGALVFVT